jgi:hypothetical protein
MLCRVQAQRISVFGAVCNAETEHPIVPPVDFIVEISLRANHIFPPTLDVITASDQWKLLALLITAYKFFSSPYIARAGITNPRASILACSAPEGPSETNCMFSNSEGT